MPKSGDKFAFSKDNVDKAPTEHGVYALYDGDELIYYGRAAGDGVTIRSRLQSHQAGNEGSCTKKATTYRRETTERPKAREIELLQEFENKHRTLPRCNERIG
jgi:excinuclease UvrABC nuclease subunit